MHTKALRHLTHGHEFAVFNKKGERRTKVVLLLTFFTMLLEITAGFFSGSMALLADGWHMSTHVVAFMITVFAYRYTRRHARDQTFAFGPGKVGVLGGFASSIVLGLVALLMLVESGLRFIKPTVIFYDEALLVAGFGLFINLVSALLLSGHHHHGDTHDHAHHEHEHEHHHHHDHNLKAAYLHVLADALTSVLAIIALILAKYYGWQWLDPVMGIVGAIIISRWSFSIMKDTGPVLLDESIDQKYKAAIKERIESDADNRIADLHVWRVGPNHFAAILSVISHTPKAPDYYKGLLSSFHKLAHVTVEVNQCTEEGCE